MSTSKNNIKKDEKPQATHNNTYMGTKNTGGKQNVFFGITFDNCNSYDAQHIAAELFLFPRITPEHASKIVDMLENGSITMQDFQDEYQYDIDEVEDWILKARGDADIMGPDFHIVMNNKLEAWKKYFRAPTKKDYDYLEKRYGITKQILYNNPTIQPEHTYISAKELANYVKQYIKGQDNAIERLSVPFMQHLESKKMHYTSKVKVPVLIMGPTGIGKTEILNRYGQACNCPVIHINSSEIVPTSWRGIHLTDILARELSDNVSLKDLEYAIIVFHEFDKITHHGQRIVGTTGTDEDYDMMRDIMRLFDTGHCLYLENGIDQTNMSQKINKLPVDNLLIVFDGAFDGMNEIIKKRMNLRDTIGFAQSAKEHYDNCNLLKNVCTKDLLEWGYTSELLGRIGDIVVMNPLTTQTIFQIMKTAKDNVLDAHIEYCSNKNIDLQFTEDAIYYIADEAQKSGLGFRKVKTLLSTTMNSIYYDLTPNSIKGKKKVVVVNKEYVMNIFSCKVK